MNLFCVLFAIAFAIAVVCAHKGKKESRFLNLAGGTVVACVAAFVVAVIIGLGIQSHIPFKTATEGTWKIVALRSSDSVSGSVSGGLLFMTGSIRGQVEYHMYVPNGDGSLSPYEVDAMPSVSIFEDKSLTDSGTWTISNRVRDCSVPLARWVLFCQPDFGSQRFDVFRVPPGTVVQKFQLQ